MLHYLNRKQLNLFLRAGFLFLSIALPAQEWRARFNRLSIEQGLSQSSVFSVAQDSDGFLWVGTKEGLNRYDGYTFQGYRHNPNIEGSISGNYILALYLDREDVLWIGTYGAGLNRYNKEFGTFTSFQHSDDAASLSHNHVRAIFEDRRGHLWVGTQDGLNRLDRESGQFTRYHHDSDDPHGLSANFIMAIHEDRDGNLWVGTFGGGLNRFDPIAERFSHYHHRPGDAFSLSNDTVYSILEDRGGTLWVGTFGGGLNRFDRNTGRFQAFRHVEDDPYSLSHDHVNALWEDRQGTLWVGTNGGGLSRFDRAHQRFISYSNDAGDALSLSNDNVLTIFEDKAGLLWVGTFGGGLNSYDQGANAMVSFRPGGNPGESVNHPNVWSIAEDHEGLLWIGTNGGGLNRYDRESGTFQAFRHDPRQPGSLSDDRVLVVHEDEAHHLWVGTFGGGLNLFQREQNSFKTYRHDEKNPHSLPVDIVFSMAEGVDGTMWIGTEGGGVCRYDLELDGFQCFQHEDDDPYSLSHNSVFAVGESIDGVLWVGTFGDGLNRLDKATGRFEVMRHDARDPQSLCNNRIYAIHGSTSGALWIGTAEGLSRHEGNGRFSNWRVDAGLPNEVIYAIVEDRRGRLWLSTNRGLSMLDPQQNTFRNYDTGDGLLSDELNQNASMISRNGEIFVGGVRGFNAFFPENIIDSKYIPPVTITELRVANQPWYPKFRQSGSPLEGPIERTESVILHHTDHMFSLDFAALDFAFPHKNLYAYRLEGYDQDWIQTDAGNRRATYTNLPAGLYHFRVKGTNHDGVWNVDGSSLQVTILPPPWLSTWAIFAYLLLAIGLISWFFWSLRQKIVREKRYAEQAEQLARNSEEVAERLRQVDRLKNDFLANTSHELRTPLHGIIGLAESLRDGVAGELDDKVHRNLNMIISSGKRLSSLVNDILDFSKLRESDLKLRGDAVDLRALTEVVCVLSEPLLRGKDLVLENLIPQDIPRICGDEDRLQQIMHNLVGNAIKFTEQGQIKIDACLRDNMVAVSVSDTGHGIPSEKHTSIFESFEQVDTSSSRAHGGTGLGLAVTRELVERHGGTIEVHSEPGMGSTFTFTLKVFEDSQSEEAQKPTPQPRTSTEPMPAIREGTPLEERAPGKADMPLILIVDDEAINRQVLVDYLGPKGYRLLEAAGGSEALELVAEHKIDLVLLDVMMPFMSGYQVCRTLRQTHSVSDLPIIFLTAKTRERDIVEGFNIGANDYLAKPIGKGELLSRVETHLRLHELSRSLEQKVASRTREIQEKNEQLAVRNRELETLERIVKAINREIEFRKVIHTILEQAKRLFTGSDNALFLLYEPRLHVFKFEAADSYDASLLHGIVFTRDELNERFIDGMKRPGEGVYYNGQFDRGRSQVHAKIPVPKSLIALSLPLEDRLAGMLIFENVAQEEAFAGLDVESVSRFREHVIAALAKATAFRDIVRAQQQLLTASRMAGMAEMAVSVQHNIGNALNSTMTSAHHMREHLKRDQRSIAFFEQVLEILPNQVADLAQFMIHDHRAHDVLSAIHRVCDKLRLNHEKLCDEAGTLEAHIRSMMDDLREQRKMSEYEQNNVVSVEADLNQLIRANLEEKHYLFRQMDLEITTNLDPLPPVMLDPTKFSRALFYLLENAWEAIEELKVQGHIRIRTENLPDGQVRVSLSDNGVGIPEDMLKIVFRHGFTTKKGKRGFGLHYCANTLAEMSGQLRLISGREVEGTTAMMTFRVAGE